MTDPLVPADIDLRGLEYMPLLGERLFNSDFELDADDAQFRVAMRLWWRAWNQVPAGSLPSEDRRLQKLAGLEEAPAKWKKVRERALHGFLLCSDGRLYHPVIAEQALIAWDKRVEYEEERDNKADRKRRERDDRKRMFADLRAIGLVPDFNIGTSDLRKLHAEHVTRDKSPDVTVTGHGMASPPVTVTGTAKTGRDETRQEIQEPARVDATTSRALAEGTAEPEDPAIGAGTRYGLAARAMRQKGCAANPGDPRLRQLVDQGASMDEFEAVGAEAADKGKGPAWALTALINRRKDAAEIRLAPGAAQPSWQDTRDGVSARGQELGIGAWQDFERAAITRGTPPRYDAYRQRVLEADQARREPQETVR